MKRANTSFGIVRLSGIIILATSCLNAGARTSTSMTGKAFPSPESAAQALAEAAKSKDRPALREVLGPASDDLQETDRIQSNQQLADFAEAYDTKHRIVRGSNSRATLEVGNDNWPLPIPLVEKDGRWYFDTDSGKEEIINRRVGQNELSTLETLRAYAGAQREYATYDRDGDRVLEYAQHVRSSPGEKDGLYWSPQLGEMSPLGPLIAVAQTAGYMKNNGQRGGTQPFRGYYFKILTRQGKDAPGGKYNYVINGNMIGGFAMVAWPADYAESGVMTFIINQEGAVYQKDLGDSTASIVKKMDAYDPDPSWTRSPD